MMDYQNNYPFSYYFQHFLNRPSETQRQGNFGVVATQGIVDMLMYGLAGIPVYKAVEKLLPLLKPKKPENRDNGRVINLYRKKRDLAYAQQLLSLLISVENALEKYGITDPQCQLRATCEIYRRNVNTASQTFYDRNFIKLVNEMRKEIRNPRVVPLAKYVFEYYEEAAERGEQFQDCKEKYPRCPHSLDYFFKKTKGKKPASWKDF